jgi:hypothetical protein
VGLKGGGERSALAALTWPDSPRSRAGGRGRAKRPPPTRPTAAPTSRTPRPSARVLAGPVARSERPGKGVAGTRKSQGEGRAGGRGQGARRERELGGDHCSGGEEEAASAASVMARGVAAAPSGLSAPSPLV